MNIIFISVWNRVAICKYLVRRRKNYGLGGFILLCERERYLEYGYFSKCLLGGSKKFFYEEIYIHFRGLDEYYLSREVCY